MTNEEQGTESTGGNGLAVGGSKTLIIVVLVIVAVVAALVFGLGGSGSSSDDDSGGGLGSGEAQPVKVVGTALAPRSESGGDTEIGKKAPTLEGFGFDGTPITIEPGKDGKPIMIAFLAHWCSHCNYQLPQLVEWVGNGDLPDDLQLYAVATSLKEDGDHYPPSKWFRDNDWSKPVMADSTQFEAARAYGLDGLPFMVVIAPDGTLAARFSGETPAADVDKEVRAALR